MDKANLQDLNPILIVVTGHLREKAIPAQDKTLRSIE